MNNGKITKDSNKLTKTKTTNNNSKKPSSKHLMTGTAIFIAAILVISGTNIKAAFADTVLNNVVSTASGKIVSVTAGGATSAVGYGLRVVGAGTDGQGGCNAEDGSTAKLTFSGAPGVTQSPNPLEINDCTGSTFPFGVTFNVPANTPAADYTIVVSVADSGSSGTVGTYDTSQAGFILRVTPPPDTTAPVVTVPGPKTVEATGPSGASVAFTATATDNIDGQLIPKCYIGQTEIASPYTFPLGTTTVECKATDAAGNTGSGTFTVTVQDTTPPTIQNVPLDMTVGAQNSGGATVTYNNPTATDLVDPSVDVTCDPASGQNFPIGIKEVTCTATDDTGNAAQATFKVTVNIPSVQYPLPPVNPDGSSTYKKGSTIPFKLGAQYAGGEQASDLVISLALLKVGPAQIEPVNEIVSTSAATTGSLFRWDSTSQQFIYNLSTKTLEPGLYKAYATVNGFGIVQSVEFNLRK